jgi:hypothetical protein
MIKISYLPHFVLYIFKGMPGNWKCRHKLVFCWLVFMQAIIPGKKTLKELSRWTPFHIPAWRFRRLLKAHYWKIDELIKWFALKAMNDFPPPKDGIVAVIGDSSHKDKRGKKNPVAQKGRKSKSKPWFFGIRFIVLAVCWDVYRIPFSIRIILPKNHPEYKKENKLFREMLQEFTPPSWVKSIIVMGDTAYASAENMKLIKKKGETDKKCNWFYLFGFPRTWKTEDGKSIKDLVTYLPRVRYKCTWIPSITGSKRKYFYVYGKRTRLRHVGDVTLVLSKKGRNVGPKKTKIFVTNLPQATARQVIYRYQQRWSIETIFKELKSGLGLGEHQVGENEDRVEKSLGIPMLSYLFLLRARKKDIQPGCPWSIFQLQNNFRWEVMKNQFEHKMDLEIKKLKKAA